VFFCNIWSGIWTLWLTRRASAKTGVSSLTPYRPTPPLAPHRPPDCRALGCLAGRAPWRGRARRARQPPQPPACDGPGG
jgi:hypothetical protein